jgi:cytosine/adenosine deaminase-related metal-dependent hydrolase
MILKNCNLLTGAIGEVIENGAVYVQDGKVIDVGTAEKILEKYGVEEKNIRDLNKKVLLPGLTNPYTSYYINELYLNSKLRDSNLPPYEKFSKIVNFALSKSEETEFFKDIMTLGSFKSLINGVTSSIVSIPYSKNISYVKEIADEIGVRVKPSPILLTENGIQRSIRDDLLENKDIKSITILGVWGLEKEDYDFLEKFLDDGRRLRIAIVDFQQEERYAMLKHGKELMNIIKENGLFSKKVDVIYAGNITPEVMDYFASKGVRLIKSVRTELMEINSSPNLLDMLGRGMKVAIGTGLIDYSLFNEAKTLLITEKFNNKAKHNILYNEVERTIFMNNYQFTSDEFDLQLGQIRSGKEADFTILSSRTGDYIFNTNTPFTEISFRMGNEIEVSGAVVGGEISLWDREPQKVDTKEIRRIQKKINDYVRKLII